MEPDSTRTPKQVSSSSSPIHFVNRRNISKSTPNNFHCHSAKFSMLKNVLNTPPSRFTKIINPFEVGLTERLHRPIICSPSLFHRPSTPQMSSTHFEWNIDEMSSLNPTSFEAHEAQFASMTDPDVEARAQAAISSFFSEQVIVPSPVDCPLRNQKIILSDATFRKNTRDGICQTELSLPPHLPKDIEDLLKPYLSQTMNQQQTPVQDCDRSIDHDARDASLRRKLFGETVTSSASEYDDHAELDCLSPPPCSPELQNNQLKVMKSQGIDLKENESFGSLSPIHVTPLKRQTNGTHNWSCESMRSIYNSTPECSVSNYLTTSSNSVNMINLPDLFDIPLVRNMITENMELTTCMMDIEGRSSYTGTPNRSRHRYSSRKNLSHSFSCLDCLDDADDVIKPYNAIILSKTDSGFSDTEDKAASDSKWHMEVDPMSPRCK